MIMSSSAWPKHSRKKKRNLLSSARRSAMMLRDLDDFLVGDGDKTVVGMVELLAGAEGGEGRDESRDEVE